jgi:mRNA interferase YafQ
MRTIDRATAFKRDYRRVKADSRYTRNIDALVVDILALLVADQPLPERNRDHALGGQWKGYRDCHLKLDLLLICSKPDAETLRLARLGSRSELFD